MAINGTTPCRQQYELMREQGCGAWPAAQGDLYVRKSLRSTRCALKMLYHHDMTSG